MAELTVDLETRDDGLRDKLGPGWPWRGGYTVGIGVATDDREWYFPIRHEAGGNVDPEAVIRWARNTFKRPRRYVFHNALYDLGWARTDGIVFAGEIHDTHAGAALLDEQRVEYSLDACARDAGHTGKDLTALIEAYKAIGGKPRMRGKGKKVADWVQPARANLWRLHSRDVGEYAIGDLVATRHLRAWQAPQLSAQSLNFIYRLECDLLPMLTEMRARGIRIDVGAAERLWQELFDREQFLQRKLRAEYGAKIIAPRHNATIAQACDRLGIAYPRTAKKGLPSFTDGWMKTHPHPFFTDFREWRSLHTNRTLVIEGGILESLHGDRIYPELSPLKKDGDEGGGAVSGRFSCSHPNAQQASGRTELGRRIRSLYLPESGALWAAEDVSQQEPRLTVHYAIRCRLPKALEAAKEFEQRADWHQIVADLVGIEREDAKPINLGLGYGMGKEKLAASLGKSLSDANAILNSYHERLPFVRRLAKICQDKAESRGYIVTYAGRRRRYDLWEPDLGWRKNRKPPEPVRGREAAEAKWPGMAIKRAYTYAALNGLIQGSAADWIKLAMRELWRAKIVPMLQVHDEIDASVADLAEAQRIGDIIRDVVSLKCPVVVDSGVGANWREAKAKPKK